VDHWFYQCDLKKFDYLSITSLLWLDGKGRRHRRTLARSFSGLPKLISFETGLQTPCGVPDPDTEKTVHICPRDLEIFF
jgi:hypothetical protein